MCEDSSRRRRLEADVGDAQGRPPPNPLVIALAATIQRHRLSRYHFQRIIDTREQYYTDQSFPTIDSMATYAQGTSFPLLSLVLQAQLSSTPSPSLPLSTLDHALSHLAHTLTFATLLHSVAHHASRRVNPLPRNLCAEAGLSEENLFRRGGNAEGVREAVEEVARLAWGELGATRRTIEGTHEHGRQGEDEKGRGAAVKLGNDVMPVFLAAVRLIPPSLVHLADARPFQTPAKAFLESLVKAKFDTFAPSLQKRPWKLPFQIWSDSFFRQL